MPERIPNASLNNGFSARRKARERCVLLRVFDATKTHGKNRRRHIPTARFFARELPPAAQIKRRAALPVYSRTYRHGSSRAERSDPARLRRARSATALSFAYSQNPAGVSCHHAWIAGSALRQRRGKKRPIVRPGGSSDRRRASGASLSRPTRAAWRVGTTPILLLHFFVFEPVFATSSDARTPSIRAISEAGLRRRSDGERRP